MPGEIMNVVFSRSQHSLVMVQALTQWMSTPVVVVGIGFSVTSLQKVIYSPVENLMGIHTFFSMVDVEDPSNILRGISVSRYKGDSLL